MIAGGPVQAHPLLTSGVGLITTLLALMSAAWILMTLEVAFVVRPLPPRLPHACPTPAATPAAMPRTLNRPQATCGVAWSIYVIVRQVLHRTPFALPCQP